MSWSISLNNKQSNKRYPVIIGFEIYFSEHFISIDKYVDLREFTKVPTKKQKEIADFYTDWDLKLYKDTEVVSTEINTSNQLYTTLTWIILNMGKLIGESNYLYTHYNKYLITKEVIEKEFLNILDSSLTQPELVDKIVKEYIDLSNIEIPKQLKD